MSTNGFADDGLRVDSDTTIEDIEEFLYRRAENPICVGDTTVWNFNSYEVDRDALEYAVTEKLENEEFVIPFQVTGTWGMMYHLLPRRLKKAEILVYHTNRGEYRAFNNFINDVPQKYEEEIRYQLGQAVFDGGSNGGEEPDG